MNTLERLQVMRNELWRQIYQLEASSVKRDRMLATTLLGISYVIVDYIEKSENADGETILMHHIENAVSDALHRNWHNYSE